MTRGKTILAKERFSLTIDRLCFQLMEEYGDFTETCIVGIQERGVLLANRITNRLKELAPKSNFEYGQLDITFYRDDFRRRDEPLKASSTKIDFLVENKKVLLIDDVLYTGRTIQAAMAAMQAFGRPSQVELLTLVDRRFNRHLPITADFVGMTVDALNEAYVKVEWAELDGQDRILFFSPKRSKD